jgi:hypothetical protein
MDEITNRLRHSCIRDASGHVNSDVHRARLGRHAVVRASDELAPAFRGAASVSAQGMGELPSTTGSPPTAQSLHQTLRTSWEPNALHTPHVVTRQTSALGTRRGRRGVRRRDHRLQRLRLERDRRRRVLDHPLAGWSERTSLVTIEGTAAPIARVSRRMEKAVDPFRFRRMRQPPCGRVAAARQRPSGAELAAT